MPRLPLAVPAGLMVAAGLAAGLALAGPAAANHSGDVDCSDFATQQQAQAHFNAHPGDPDNLDADNDGVACEQLPGGPGGTGDVVPVGGVSAGGGGAAGGDPAYVPWLLTAAGGGLAVAGVRLRRRRS